MFTTTNHSKKFKSCICMFILIACKKNNKNISNFFLRLFPKGEENNRQMTSCSKKMVHFFFSKRTNKYECTMPLVKKWDGTGHYFDIFVKSFSRKKISHIPRI